MRDAQRRRLRRPVPRALCLVLLTVFAALTACARTPPGGAQANALGGPQDAGAAASSDTTQDQAASSSAAASAASASGASGGGAQASGGGGSGSSRATSSSSTAGGGGAGSVAPLASWQGVTPTTIKVAFAGKLHNCADDGNSNDSSQGVLVAKDGQTVKAFVEYFNKYYALPGGRHMELVGNDTSLGIPAVDEGGSFCPSAQKAAASYVVNQLKPFAVIGGDAIFNQTVAAARTTLDIENSPSGPAWVTDQQESQFYPYAWSGFGVADEYLGYLADYMAKRVAGTQYNAPSGGVPPSGPRVIGLAAYTGTANDDALVAAAQADYQRVGVTLAHIYRISHDNATGSQQAVQLALQMRQDGVNTVIWGFPGGGSPALALANAFDGANYHPDIMLCFDGVPLFDQLYPQDQFARASGVWAVNIIALRIDLQHYNNYVENSGAYDAVWAASAEYDGKGAQNGAGAYGWWTLLGMLAVGLSQGPVNFTPQTWADGLTATSAPDLRCPVGEILGRDHPQYVHWNWTKTHPSGANGYTTIYWVNKTSSFGTTGYFESYDGYYAYFGLNDLPDKPSDDTGNQSLPPAVQQPPLGLSPFKTCKSIGLKGTKYPGGQAG